MLAGGVLIGLGIIAAVLMKLLSPPKLS